MGKIKLINVIFFLYLTAESQSKISGTTQDNAAKPIASASIFLKDDTNKTVSYTYCDEKGQYSLQVNKLGDFKLIVNAMGFEQKTIAIRIEQSDEIKIINFNLDSTVTELKEIIIPTEKPITIHGDTITFLVKSFTQGNELVVEDLLKKIPGLNIDSKGTIRIGNQEIEKIMIDGDDMFEKGYKILTKNMPVNPVEKVELYQNYSNNKLLKGIENSNKVALNLTLKEDAKRVWFGNIQAGFDANIENRYEFRANLMNFGKKNKHYFLTNVNNIGFNASGDINNLVRPYRFDEPASIGDDQSAYSILGLGASVPNLKEKRVNFNNAEMLSLNSIFTLSDKIKLKTLGFLNTDEIDFFKKSIESLSVGNTSFVNNEDFTARKINLTGFGKIDLTYDISKDQTLEYIGKFNKRNERHKSDLLFNSDFLNERLTTSNQLFDQKVVLTNKVKKNKVFLLSGRYINEKTPQQYTINQFIFDELFTENADNTRQLSENQMQFIGVEAHVMDKKQNGDLLEIKFGNQLRIDNLYTRFELLEDEISLAFPNGYQNDLTYSTNDLYISAKYRFKLKNFTILTQSDFHQLFNQLESFEVKTSQNPFFIMPKIGLDWKINDHNKILTSYTINTTNAGVLDIYSGFVQTGFRSFSKGLEEFNQLNSQSATLNYTYGSWGDKFFANTFLLYSKNNDFYSTNSIVTQNYSQSKNIIIKDRELLTISSNIDRYFKPIKSNLKLTIGGTKTNFKNIVNNSNLREVKNLNANYGFELRSGFRSFFNYHIGSKWTYNQIETTIINSFTDNLTFLDLSFLVNDKLNFQLQTERYFFGNLASNSNQYYFMDLEACYVAKENKLTFSLSGNNLFNIETFRNNNITDVSVLQTEYRLQPRYVLLKMEVRL
jgi:hypothetical protein